MALLLALAAAGCGGSKRAATTGEAASSAPRDRWGTIWLCRPGERPNPCVTSLTTTVVRRNGHTSVVRTAPAASPPVDCFYVYPTVSDEATVNANLRIGLPQIAVATTQAARFSQVCNVYAPVYRQITLSALDHPQRITLADARITYRSVLTAFRSYLEHYNHGRGIVLIGHSQGATVLIKLIQQQIDDSAALRKRLVSALIMGGNVTVPKGRTEGGDFAHIPACTSSGQTGCVVAYSSFAATPPADSQFARTTSDAGVGLLAPRAPPRDLRILCVNPAAPAGGTAPLDAYLPSFALSAMASPGQQLSVTTPWVAFPGEYTGHCETSGNATWLQVTPAAPGDHRPSLTRVEQPAIGLHVLDVNIALGDLVRLVAAQSAAYRRK
jgi:pimeloyl-ACP methyl ester carboxylesterase